MADGVLTTAFLWLGLCKHALANNIHCMPRGYELHYNKNGASTHPKHACLHLYTQNEALAIVFNGDHSTWVTVHLHNEVATQVLSTFILHKTFEGNRWLEFLAQPHMHWVSVVKHLLKVHVGSALSLGSRHIEYHPHVFFPIHNVLLRAERSRG